MRRLLLVALFAVLIGGSALLFQRAVQAQGPLVGATHETVDPGGSGTAELYSEDFGAPGLGAWTINVVYDPDVITITGCGGGDGSTVCNPEYESDTVRSAGADAFGLEGGHTLAEIRFTCSDEGGMSPLDVQAIDVSDATVGAPVLLDPEVSDGSVTCEEGDGGTPTGGATPTSGTQGNATPVPNAPDAGTGTGAEEEPWRVLALLGLLASAGLVAAAYVRVASERQT